MKNAIFKQNSFETEVNCPEKALNFTTEPLQGAMMVYSGHCPHTKCLRHFSVGLTTNRSLRDLAPMCLRHNGAPRLKENREKRIDNGVINENLMDKITKFTLFCVYLQCINKYEAKKRHIFCVSI